MLCVCVRVCVCVYILSMCVNVLNDIPVHQGTSACIHVNSKQQWCARVNNFLCVMQYVAECSNEFQFLRLFLPYAQNL